MERVEIRLDASTLVLRIPMRFQRWGGRKRIVAPDGTELVPTSKPQPDGMLIKALARAWRWQGMLHEGVYASVSEIGDAEDISKSYVSRILRLALLAPDIVEAIRAGKADQSLMFKRLERPLPASRCEQRRLRTVAVGIPFSARPCPVGGRPKMLGWVAVWKPQRDRLASGSRDALDRDHPLARLTHWVPAAGRSCSARCPRARIRGRRR
jgi:hypothetical protein